MNAEYEQLKEILVVTAANVVALGIVATTWLVVCERQQRDRARDLLYMATVRLAKEAWQAGTHRGFEGLVEDTREQAGKGFEWDFLNRQRHAWVKPLSTSAIPWTRNARALPLEAIDFSPEARVLATGDHDGIIRLWKLIGVPKQMAGFRWFEYGVQALALDRRGGLLAASGDGGVIGLMNLKRPTKSPAWLRGHAHDITSLDFDADSRFLASSAADGTIRVWATNEPQAPPAILRGHLPDWHPQNENYDQNHVSQVVFSRDGRWLIAGARDGSVQIWEATDLAKAARVFHAHDDGVDAISVSPDSTLLATAGRDQKILLWSLGDTRAPPCLLADCGTETVTAIVFDPTGTYLGTVIGNKVRLLPVKPVTVQKILID